MGWYYICALLLTIVIVVVSTLYMMLRFRCLFFKKHRGVGPALSVTTVCLGRTAELELGMLYASSNDTFVLEKIWSRKDIKRATKSSVINDLSPSFEVITDDSLAKKMDYLGVGSDLAISFLSGLVKTSRSAEYLHDIRSSARQARVVLRYHYTAKVKELNMPKPAKVTDDKLIKESSATHVVVGVEYGAEVFFIFDKDVSEDDDYYITCREMESLVAKLPEIAKGKEKLSEEEILLSKQLRFTLYSDIPLFLDASTFDHAVNICSKKFHEFAAMPGMVIPKKAWLYPLHYIDKNAATVNNIEQHYVTSLLDLLDQLQTLDIKCNSLIMKEEMHGSFDGIREQLIKLFTMTKKHQRKLKKKIKTLTPKIRQKQCDGNAFDSIITTVTSFCNSSRQWLLKKEDEIHQISEYLTSLHCPGITMLMDKEQFKSYVNCELGADNCIISLEFQVGQYNEYDPEEEFWYDDHQFKINMINKIEEFKAFASNCKGAKFAVTSSQYSNSSQDGIVVLFYEPGSGLTYPREFDFPSPLGTPIGESTSWDKIKVTWSIPWNQIGQPVSIIIFFRSTEEHNWQEKSVQNEVTEVQIDGLKPETAYVFKVAAKYKYGLGPESMISDEIFTDLRPLAVKISENKTLSGKITSNRSRNDNSPIQYRLKTKSVLKDEQKMIAKEEFGQPHYPSKPTKVLMVMGATGAGKSTLINGMINFILGVQHKDSFRFKLICDETKESQAHSQTSVITAYTFYWQEGFVIPYNLIIIDTPGFGDTRGLDRDKLITAQVKELFSIEGINGIDQIHGIGFVTQSSLVRLTPTQRYVYDSILSIFGNDVKKNIFIMATFADSANPNVMEAVSVAKIPHAGFFPFNNSALYQGTELEYSSMFWDMGCRSFTAFFDHLQSVDAISLNLTREVLKERENLEIVLNGIHPKIQEGLSKMDTLQKEETILRSKDSDLKANKDFTYKIKITKQRKVDLRPGIHVTNCLICNFTCHKPCGIPNDGDKYGCAAMDRGGPNGARCTVCPQRCGWREHCNNPYYFELYTEEETRRSEDLWKRYNIAKDDVNAAERIIESLHNELGGLSIRVYKDVKEARRCIERLSTIALKPNPMTEVEYIDLLIESEKQEKKKGFQDRIAAYSNMRKQAQIMSKMSNEEIDKDLQQTDKKKWWQLWIS